MYHFIAAAEGVLEMTRNTAACRVTEAFSAGRHEKLLLFSVFEHADPSSLSCVYGDLQMCSSFVSCIQGFLASSET